MVDHVAIIAEIMGDFPDVAEIVQAHIGKFRQRGNA